MISRIVSDPVRTAPRAGSVGLQFGIPIPSDQTTGAMDTEPRAVQHYGFCIDELYHESRTHLALAKDTPVPRPVQSMDVGRVVAIPQVGGLHHRYERRAA
jgi:hypothetical protein